MPIEDYNYSRFMNLPTEDAYKLVHDTLQCEGNPLVNWMENLFGEKPHYFLLASVMYQKILHAYMCQRKTVYKQCRQKFISPVEHATLEILEEKPGLKNLVDVGAAKIFLAGLASGPTAHGTTRERLQATSHAREQARQLMEASLETDAIHGELNLIFSLTASLLQRSEKDLIHSDIFPEDSYSLSDICQTMEPEVTDIAKIVFETGTSSIQFYDNHLGEISAITKQFAEQTLPLFHEQRTLFQNLAENSIKDSSKGNEDEAWGNFRKRYDRLAEPKTEANVNRKTGTKGRKGKSRASKSNEPCGKTMASSSPTAEKRSLAPSPPWSASGHHPSAQQAANFLTKHGIDSYEQLRERLPGLRDTCTSKEIFELAEALAHLGLPPVKVKFPEPSRTITPPGGDPTQTYSTVDTDEKRRAWGVARHICEELYADKNPLDENFSRDRHWRGEAAMRIAKIISRLSNLDGVNKIEEQLAWQRKAIEADPTFPPHFINHARTLMWKGDNQSAIPILKKLLLNTQNHTIGETRHLYKQLHQACTRVAASPETLLKYSTDALGDDSFRRKHQIIQGELRKEGHTPNPLLTSKAVPSMSR
jgi:tetratricopeptide (TPR) repeat protein